MTQNIQVSSEIGRLRKLIVHTPGPEVLAVTPSNRREYLYDDIIDLDRAAEEHRRFTALLGRFCEVVEVSDLFEQTIAIPEAKDFLLARTQEFTADNNEVTQGFAELVPEEIARRYVEGWQATAGPLSKYLRQRIFALPPLPNLFFTRDASMIIGDQVVISSMRFETRWAEEVLMRTILGFHPDFSGANILYDGSKERHYDYILEGGDVHPLNPEVVLVGMSPRTSVAAIDHMAELLFANTPVTDLITVMLPDAGAAIHLDMVWTQVDRESCVAFQPLFHGAQRAPVLHRHKGEAAVREPADLFAALASVGIPMEPIWAGGPDRESQEREQWASGCNFLALAPGQIVSYERNEQTLGALERAGFRVVPSEALLLGDADVSPGDRVVITFAGAELVRGGGGPRCMSCPILRDEL